MRSLFAFLYVVIDGQLAECLERSTLYGISPVGGEPSSHSCYVCILSTNHEMGTMLQHFGDKGGEERNSPPFATVLTAQDTCPLLTGSPTRIQSFSSFFFTRNRFMGNLVLDTFRTTRKELQDLRTSFTVSEAPVFLHGFSKFPLQNALCVVNVNIVA